MKDITQESAATAQKPAPCAPSVEYDYVEESDREFNVSKFEEALMQMPRAGFGQGFNDQALPRAVGFAKRGGLTQEEAIQRISETQKGPGRNTEAEIRSTVERLYSGKRERTGRSEAKLPPADPNLLNSITGNGTITVEALKAESPVKGAEGLPPKEFLKVLFPGDPILTVGKKTGQKGYRAETALLSSLTDRFLNTQEFVVPSPAIRRKGKAVDGNSSKHSKDLYPYRQYLVVEFDAATKDQAATVLHHLSQYAPLVMAVDSGGKSLHGWFCCSAVNETDVYRFFRYACLLGADRKMWAKLQFSRLPHGVRFGTNTKQSVLYWAPNAVGGKWNLDELPDGATVLSIMDIPTEQSSESNLLGERFLSRGRAVGLIGQTGVGKSSLILQAMMNWSLGKDFMGLRAERPLRCLLVQAENDDADLRAMRDGIITGLNLEGSSGVLAENLHYCSLNTCGDQFLAELDRLLERHKPDLVTLDPLFAYLGTSASEQKEVSSFLRNKLQPLLENHGVGCIISHHTNKPPSTKKDRPEWNEWEFAYAGSGSSEIANWLRGIMCLRRTENTDVFELIFAKRHKQAAIKDEKGELLHKVVIKHSGKEGLIFWEAGDVEDALPPDYIEKLQDFLRAHQRIAENGQAKRKAIADEMGVTVRTIDRLFQDKDFLLVTGPDGEPIKFVKTRGIIANVSAGPVRCELRGPRNQPSELATNCA